MSILFSPFTIGKMTVKNRFVRSATHDRSGNEDGTLTSAEFDLYRELAANDVGLIITGHAYISHPLGRASVLQNGIYEDRFIAGYAQLAELVHSYGAKLVVQISHAGRQTGSLDLVEGRTPIAPSAVKETTTGIIPREMTEFEIWQMVDDFVNAMVRVQRSGSDGVQFHIAHGYALSQFLSPFTNRRKDAWGGTVEKRTRILREIAVRGRMAVGPDFPILVKLNSTDGLNGSKYLSLEDVLYTAKMLEGAGISAIEVSGGIREIKGSMSRPGIRQSEQEAYFAQAAKAIKQTVNIPIILVGGLRSLSVMESIVAGGAADAVALSRPFIKEPDLVAKFKNGETKTSCISCNGCFNPGAFQCALVK